jgi:hypothetical protein
MRNVPILAIAALASAATLAIPAAASSTAGAESVLELMTAARTTQAHFGVESGTERVVVRVSGEPGTNYELFLSRNGNAKQVSLLRSRIPQNGKIRLSLELPKRLPAMKFCSQAESAIDCERL